MTALTSVFAAIGRLVAALGIRWCRVLDPASRPAIALKCARAGSQPGSASVAVTSSRRRPALGDLIVETAEPLLHLAVDGLGGADLLPHRLQLAVQPGQLGRRRLSSRFSALSSAIRLTTDCQSMSANSRVWSSAGQHLTAVDRGVPRLLITCLLFGGRGELVRQ